MTRRIRDSERSREIQAHLEHLIDEGIERGLTREEAEREAYVRFGNPRVVREELHDMHTMAFIDSVKRDARYAIRILRKSPSFTITAVLTLALAIGANTAVFSVVDALVLKPLPYPQPDRLALMSTRVENAAGAASEQIAQDGRMWETIRDHAATVDRAVYSDWFKGVNLVGPDGVAYVQQQRVGTGFFKVLGVAPLMGREFTPEEDRPGGGAAAVAVLSYELWQRMFNGDPDVVGRSITLRGETFAVTGVMPQGFRTSAAADLWTPLRPSMTGEGGGANYAILLRLRDGRSWAEATAEIAALGAQGRTGPSEGWKHTHWAMPLQQGMSSEDVRRQVFVLWGAVAVVLLIACSNLAGLMLARAGRRQREIATRMAIGSGRAAVVRQLLVESLVLAIAGGLAGCALGYAGIQILSTVAADVFGIWQPLQLDARVLAVTGAIALGSALVVGLAPAWQASRLDMQAALVESGARGSTAASRWPHRLLIVAEVALGVVLLVCAGLLVRTFVNLRSLQPGFDATGVVAATISLDDVRYRDPQRATRLFEDSLARIRETPGVETAAVSLGVPYQRLLNMGVRRLDGDAAAREGAMTNLSYITSDFFTALRIPLQRGRTFEGRDTADAEPVVIVNDAFAARSFEGEDPLGRRLSVSGRERRIVGIVGSVQLNNPGWGGFGPIGAPPVAYVPIAQTSPAFLGLVHTWFSPVWIVRSERGVQGLEPVIRAAVASADPQLPVASIQSMEEVVSRALARQRFMAALIFTLGAIAALLAAVGIHGLVAATVTERTRELGIRMALGATTRQAMQSVAVLGIVLAAVGVAVGSVAAVWVVRLVQSLLWGVEPTDPLTFAGVAMALIGVAAIASTIPALRVLRLDPSVTLRAE